jgi:hypothetical protein
VAQAHFGLAPLGANLIRPRFSPPLRFALQEQLAPHIKRTISTDRRQFAQKNHKPSTE